MKPQFLLEGAHYALVQCGRLLTSAAILYRTGEHSTAVVLAALAREEFGRFRYLRDQWKEVVVGKTLSVEEIRDACKDHVKKQEWGQAGVVLRSTTITALLQTLCRASPESKEYQEANRKIEEIVERKRGRAPRDRHAQRMKAIYVEPNDLGTDWNKPWEMTKEEAGHFIEEAIADYGVQKANRWSPGVIKLENPELAQALEAWTGRPVLPPIPNIYEADPVDR